MLEHMENKGLSQRAACRQSGVSRAVSRYKLRRPAQDSEYLKKMRTAAQANPRYGYRRVAVVSGIGSGRAWRLWKEGPGRVPNPPYVWLATFSFASVKPVYCFFTVEANLAKASKIRFNHQD